ncbi:MAG: hypothetical protein KGL99_03630 [Burkholderiales bacterium]|nr:hypothetical protein [Burkholderiales bacterium]MDE2626223.1 hypothetical protein [Burkholderiales bacterium]
MSSAGSPPPPQRVPTLTEVVAWPESATAAVRQVAEVEAPALEANLVAAASSMPRATPSVAPTLTEEQLVQRVLAEVQHQVDLMLEYRLREVLTPLLARAADSVIREARGELASTLRDVVARAVAHELARHRGR